MATINGKALVKDGKPLDRAYSNGLLVYGRNLLLGTQSFTGGTSIWADRTANTSETYKGLGIYQTSSAWASPNYQIQNAGILEVGKIYTFSTYLRNTSDTELTVVPYFDDKVAGGFNVIGKIVLEPHSEWVRAKTVINIMLDPATSTQGMRWEATTSASGGYLQFAGYKLEKGNVATDWTPAPEDYI